MLARHRGPCNASPRGAGRGASKRLRGVLGGRLSSRPMRTRPASSPCPATLPLVLALLSCSAPLGQAAQQPRPAEATSEASSEASSEGALGIGDPYYPGIGNGGYDVEHYDLGLALELDPDRLQAEARLRATATQALTSFSLDLYGLEVGAVEVDGEVAAFERLSAPGESGEERSAVPTELRIRPARALEQGARFEVLVRYSGTPQPRPDPSVPFIPGIGWMRCESGVFVLSECIGASSWYPCNDHPRDKATYTFRITLPRPWTAAANGILTETHEEGEHRTFVFEARDPMASALATLNVSDFGVLAAEGPRGIPVRVYHPSGATEEELAPFRRQPEILAFLESVFGPYPFEAAGGVLTRENLGGALECQTIPVYSKGASEGVIVHELAHQWFGDCVSVDLWRDIWLNEGFATYAGWLWNERTEGAEAYTETARRSYRMLRGRSVGSPFDPGVSGVFSGRVYTRGAMVLWGLRAEVGDEAFFRTLKTWVETHHDGNGSTADFVAHASATAKRDLKPFFDAWLYSEVTPEVAAFGPVEPGSERGRRRRGGGDEQGSGGD